MFEDIPWGDYTLTASPPNETPLSVSVSVEEPYQILTVAFPGETGFEFSGKVVRGDTNQPVEGIPIQLTYNTNLDETIRSGQPHGVELSKEDGSFHFTNVQPGRYMIQVLTRLYYKGFLPKHAFFIPENPFMKDFGINVVIDKNVADYILQVFPGVETHIQGTVVNNNGTPVSGVSLKLKNFPSNAAYDMEIPLVQGAAKSDDSGNFDISFITSANDNVYKAHLDAAQIKDDGVKKNFDSISEVGGMGTIGMMGAGSGNQLGFVQAQGSLPLEFKVGETISDIRIVLKDIDPYIIEGKISTEDGGWPKQVMLYVNSQNTSTIAKIDEEGNYHAELPTPGTYYLQVGVTQMAEIVKGFGAKSRKEYCDEYLKVELNEENHSVHKDITLEKGYYLYGRVIDKDQNPIPNLFVTAKAMSEGKQVSSGSAFSTNEQGYFTITGLRRNYEHNLVVKKSFTDKNTLARMDGLIPVEFECDQVVLIVVDNGS